MSMSFDQFLAYRNFFPKDPPIFLRYICKIKVSIYPWLPIFSSMFKTTYCGMDYDFEDINEFELSCVSVFKNLKKNRKKIKRKSKLK